MKHRLLTILAALSLLLFVAVVVLWVRSWSSSDHVQWRRVGNGIMETWRLTFADGRVGLSGGRTVVQNVPPGDDWSWGVGLPIRVSSTWPEETIPVWHMMIYAGVLPLWWTVRSHYSTLTRRRKLRLCLHCGYDLRATPGRCPECGAVARATL